MKQLTLQFLHFAVLIFLATIPNAQGGFLYQALINKSSQKTVALTADTYLATMVTTDGFTYTVTLLNLQTLSYGILLQNHPHEITTIKQIKNYNTPSTNTFLLANQTNCSLLTNNLTTQTKSWPTTGNTTLYKPLLGQTPSYYFQIIQNSTDVQFNQISTNNGAKIYNYTRHLQTAIQVEYSNNKVLLLDWSASSLNLIIFNIPGKSVIITLNIQIPDTINTKLSTSDPYFAMASANVFQMHSSTANYLKIWNTTLSENITGIKLSSLWAFIVTNTTLYQYYIGNGSQVCNISHSVIDGGLEVGEFNGSTWVYLWNLGGTEIRAYKVISGQVSNLLNYTVISVPTGGSTVPPTNDASGKTSNTTTTLNFPQCIAYNNNNQCISFCPFGCIKCQIPTGTCLSCKKLYQMSEQGDCHLKVFSKMLMVAGTVLYTVRVNSLQRMYLLIDDFKFHSYHNTKYTGILAEVLETINTFQQNLWIIINTPQIVHYIDKPLDLPSYASFTNPKFMQVQRSDSFFLQNTKQYFMFYIPFSVLLFLALNRLFFVFYRYRFSVLLRYYSLAFSIVMIVVGQNMGVLVFYGCYHVKNLFSFNTHLYFLQAFTVVFIGLCIILTVSFFFLCKYFYREKSRIFLVNLYRTKGSFQFVVIRYVIKPILQAIIHALMYQNYEKQILTIACLDTIFFASSGVFQILKNASKTKAFFVADLLFDFSVSMINFILYFKQAAYPELNKQFEYFVQAFIYLIVSVVGFNVVYSILLLIKNFLKSQPQVQKSQTEKQKNKFSQKLIQQKKNSLKAEQPRDAVIFNIVDEEMQNYP